jgi:hypothetical protein
VAAFDRHGIPVLAVKGVVLANVLYEDVVDRPMVDVDLRVRPQDLPRARQVALVEGWRVDRTSRQLGTLDIWVGHIVVEIETTIGPPGVCAIGVKDMLERSVVLTDARGLRYRAPELHDHALVLCVNAFKDKLRDARPSCVHDLIRIARQPAFDPAATVDRASAARLMTAVAIVAEWVALQDASSRWREVAERLGPRTRRRAYAWAYRAAIDGQWPLARTAAAILARSGSDDPWMRCQALFLGAVGTLRSVAV